MKKVKEKGFTLIELIVVIAILGVLVLLAAPRFLGHTEDARLVQIQNDVKVIENALEIELLDDSDFIANKGWESISLETMNGYVEEGSLFDIKGNVNGELSGGEFYIIEDELAKTKLNGQFIAEKGGKVYYYERGLNVGGDDGENVGGNEEENVYLATDDDFIWFNSTSPGTYFNSDGKQGYFRYLGTGQEIIEIPHVIQGVEMTSYYNMFNGTGKDVKKVISTNEKVTDMSNMFRSSQASSLDLSGLDTSNVTNMSYMFAYSQANSLDLNSFNTSKVTDMSYMFMNSPATSLDLSSFDTSSVTNMSNMFRSSQAASLDLSKFNTFNVTDMSYMFGDSQATSLNLSSLNTSNVTDMSYMFAHSQAELLDLSSFTTSSDTDMSYMFMDSQATKGYAKTQADANRFNDSIGKPSGLTFIVHPNLQ